VFVTKFAYCCWFLFSHLSLKGGLNYDMNHCIRFHHCFNFDHNSNSLHVHINLKTLECEAMGNFAAFITSRKPLHFKVKIRKILFLSFNFFIIFKFQKLFSPHSWFLTPSAAKLGWDPR